MEFDKKGVKKNRTSVFLTGVASTFVERVPLKSKGTVLSLIISHAIQQGYLKDALAPLFTEDQVSEFVGTLCTTHKVDVVTTVAHKVAKEESGDLSSAEKLKEVQKMWEGK